MTTLLTSKSNVEASTILRRHHPSRRTWSLIWLYVHLQGR